MDHINMELRSSRSRSRTPLIFQKELANELATETSVRVTRSTIYRTHETSLNEAITEKSSKTKNIRSTKNITSDYSSEEGDNEVSSTRHIDQNNRNEYIEESHDSRSYSNGNSKRLSALNVYKEAGEYWNRYPKTDYTYSPHSKDRIEISPGVYQMPNMSRTNIKTYMNSSMDMSHKQTNTDSLLNESDYIKSTAKIQPRTLFTNNNNTDHTYSYKRTLSQQRNIFIRIVSVFTSFVSSVFVGVVSSFFALFATCFETPNSCFFAMGAVLHRFASRIMLLDTQILRGNQRNQKVPLLFGLCLLPLLFLGGWWLMSGLSQTIYPTFSPTTTTPLITTESTLPITAAFVHKKDAQIIENVIKIQLDSPTQTGLTDVQLNQIADTLKTTYDLDIDTDAIIQILLGDSHIKRIENPTNQLNAEQIAQITNHLDIKYDINNVIERILESPSIQNVINNYNSDAHETILKNLQNEIEQLKLVTAKLRNDNAAYASHFNYQINKCCRKNFINIEGYVETLIRNLLGAPKHINKGDFAQWLRTLYVAKDDLEMRLNNLTGVLNRDFDLLIANNAELIMGEVNKRLNQEIDKGGFNKLNEVGVASEAFVYGIVKRSLAVYDADKTGLVDYALESSGGQIISTRCTESYQAGTAVVSILGIPLWHISQTPRTVITPGVTPGECWAFQNFPGFLIIKLSTHITIDAFSYEHVSKSLMPSGHIDSAPKSFSVYGLHAENDKEPTFIGDYLFTSDGDSLQYFPAQISGLVFDMVELRVVSNHGNPNYTCLYRFRVHGKLVEQPT